MLDLISKNYLYKVSEKVRIMSSVSYMDTISIKNMLMGIFFCILSMGLVPLMVSGNFSLFLNQFIVEKEEKTLYLMEIHGMNMKFYIFVNYIFFFISSVIGFGFIYIGCRYILEMSLFVENNFFVLFGLFCAWYHSQISQAIILQNFSKNTKISSVFGYLYSIFTIIASVYLNCIFLMPMTVPIYLLLVPQMSFARAISIMSINTLDDKPVRSIFEIKGELLTCIISLLVFSTVYLAIGCYLMLRSKRSNFKQKPFFNNVQQKQNDFCQKEVEIVKLILSNQDSRKYAFVCDEITKSFHSENGHVIEALKKVSFHIKKGEIYGLLGPNGAGKSTLINIITGLVSLNDGIIHIDGIDINQDKSEILQNIGVCPQFDCLWPELTVEDHFLFYTRMRGYHRFHEQLVVNELLNSMNLTAFREKRIDQLSGGTKRRVSIGIATCGSSKLMILDEPTSGLDPGNRLEIWKILKSIGRKSTILLTTHFMEEADILCDRIGIINSGRLLCSDYTLNLKKKMGAGFILNCILILDQSFENLLNFVKEFDEGFGVISEGKHSISLKIGLKEERLTEFCQFLQNNRSNFGIHRWSLNHTDLNEVFVSVVKNDNKQ